MRAVAAVAGVLLSVAGAAAASSPPTVATDRGCYLVGADVNFRGSGFAARRAYDVTIDGVDFGQARTDGTGSLHEHVVPGGLPAGVAQSVEQLAVSDGSTEAATTFTVTRSAGARFMASRGDPRTLRDRFQVWGFAQDGSRRAVYLHYIGPSGTQRQALRLGHTGGQCGYLLTAPMRFFPFSPTTGRWTLQVDTQPRYASRPAGPVARIYVQIARR